MSQFIKGPARGKVKLIREAGGILLEIPPDRLAPGTGSYICVLVRTEEDVAAVINDKGELTMWREDVGPKAWLHVDELTLKRLLYDGDSV